MKSLIQKLKFHKHDDVLILNEPEDFLPFIKELNATITSSLIKTSCVDCALLFITSKKQLFSQMLTLFPKLKDDSVLWIAYPNSVSKAEILELYNNDIWDELMDYRLQPVRKIELNSDWDALRFRKIEYLKP